MSIVSTLFEGECPEGAVDGSVDEEAAGDAVAEGDFDGEAKCIESVAGLSWSWVRFMVIDTAGL